MPDYSQEDETRVVLDYTNRDFAAIRSQLVGLVKGLMPEWETAGENSDFGTLLLEAYAYMGDVLHFYIDRAASEAFLGSALRRSSVLYIADMFGYRPVGQHSASVRLLFSIAEEAEEAITIPAKTLVHNETDNADNVILFELDSEVFLDPAVPSTDVEVYATEGYTIDNYLLGYSNGTPTMEFVIPEKGVVNRSLEIQTREGGSVVPWSEITDIALARPTQSAFTTFLDDLDNTHVLFGDNAAGRIPAVDAEIFATYRVGVGARANDVPSDALSVIVASSDLSDQMWSVTMRNPDAPVGGTDVESVDSMRLSIPRSGRIKNRALTLNDYADLALQVPGVAKSTAYGSMYTAIHVRVAPVGGVGDEVYMGKLLAEVDAYMEDKVLVGSEVYFEPTDLTDLWQYVYIRMTVHVQPAYNRTQVRQEVDRAIRDVLAFDVVDFGTRVSIGLMYRTALSITGVEWIELDHLSGAAPLDETDLKTTPVVEEIGLPAYTETAIKIPKIEPTEVIETEVDFPSSQYPWLSEEEERTHDGLWVIGQGGLPGT